MLVQCFAHARQVDGLPLPGVSDLHLVLYVAGDAVMRVHSGGKPERRRRFPGSLELMVPGQATVRSYDAAVAPRSIQVHIPRAAAEQAAARLGGPAPDFEAISAGLGAGDPLTEHLMRSLPAARDAGDLYAESAAAFLAVHLLTQGRGQAAAGPERAAVAVAIAVMRDRLSGPLTLSDIAAEAHLSVYHFIRVFREATGQTPYRFLTRLRIERARQLLADPGLTVEQIAERCGFSNAGSLSAAFLAHTGTRPSAYRKI